MKDAFGGVQSVLVLGGRSEIGLAVVRALARGRTRRAVLAVRNPDERRDLEPLGDAALDRIELAEFDAGDPGGHEELVSRVFSGDGDIDLVVLAFGVLGDQAQAERDGVAARAVVEDNFAGAVSVLVPVVRALREQGHGSIVVLSSVAAERPRRSNFVYGSSKAGLDAFARGLADSLVGTGVSVMVVRPGFVKTKMTAHLDPAPLSTTPEAVADAVVDGLQSGRRVVWVPGALRWVMLALKTLPGPMFRRLPL